MRRFYFCASRKNEMPVETSEMVENDLNHAANYCMMVHVDLMTIANLHRLGEMLISA